MKKAVTANADIGEAIIAVSADRTIRGIFGKEELDLSTREKEFEQDIFPLNQIFDPNDCHLPAIKSAARIVAETVDRKTKAMGINRGMPFFDAMAKHLLASELIPNNNSAIHHRTEHGPRSRGLNVRPGRGNHAIRAIHQKQHAASPTRMHH
jgi:hypothetical protein